MVTVPVLVVTGRDASRHELRTRHTGAAEFLEKPVDRKRLAQSILRLTSGAAAA
ncbi:MAG: hypothetical protein HOP12_09315 [Candidatus Eisenbacteria bacterium]|uniref:Response regulatory domain-containing protein n=1 Tax=Eiseniibacteriota bacterium TaxID=2212470 RepID=A0A849SP06_UNCEI|nr:hypothetical protein [Candidatus Eisenbacteria bacterium]